MARPTRTDEEKKADGTYRPSRAFPLPPGDKSAPTAPNDLRPDEAIIWDQLVNLMSRSNLLYKQDYFSIKIFCQLYARYEKNKAIVDIEGESTDGKFHSMAYKTMMHCSDRIVKLGSKFGLTPVDRLGLGEGKDDEDAVDLDI